MHPVKSERAIAQAYRNHGVRTFSLDSHEELEKIVRATTTDGVAATDLELCVRIRVSSDHAKLSLAAKFGAEPSEVADLLIATRLRRRIHRPARRLRGVLRKIKTTQLQHHPQKTWLGRLDTNLPINL